MSLPSQIYTGMQDDRSEISSGRHHRYKKALDDRKKPHFGLANASVDEQSAISSHGGGDKSVASYASLISKGSWISRSSLISKSSMSTVTCVSRLKSVSDDRRKTNFRPNSSMSRSKSLDELSVGPSVSSNAGCDSKSVASKSAASMALSLGHMSQHSGVSSMASHSTRHADRRASFSRSLSAESLTLPAAANRQKEAVDVAQELHDTVLTSLMVQQDPFLADDVEYSQQEVGDDEWMEYLNVAKGASGQLSTSMRRVALRRQLGALHSLLEEQKSSVQRWRAARNPSNLVPPSPPLTKLPEDGVDVARSLFDEVSVANDTTCSASSKSNQGSKGTRGSKAGKASRQSKLKGADLDVGMSFFGEVSLEMNDDDIASACNLPASTVASLSETVSEVKEISKHSKGTKAKSKVVKSKEKSGKTKKSKSRGDDLSVAMSLFDEVTLANESLSPESETEPTKPKSKDSKTKNSGKSSKKESKSKEKDMKPPKVSKPDKKSKDSKSSKDLKDEKGKEARRKKLKASKPKKSSSSLVGSSKSLVGSTRSLISSVSVDPMKEPTKDPVKDVSKDPVKEPVKTRKKKKKTSKQQPQQCECV